MWHLEAPDDELADIERQILWIFEKMPSDLLVWKTLTREFSCDIFCGFFMAEEGNGIDLSASCSKAMSDRNVKLGVCLYPSIKKD